MQASVHLLNQWLICMSKGLEEEKRDRRKSLQYTLYNLYTGELKYCRRILYKLYVAISDYPRHLHTYM